MYPHHTPAKRITRGHLPLHFILGCQADTSRAHWEPIVSAEQYHRWRDALIRVGWAEWINPREQGQGWRLARHAGQIMQTVFLA